ncbi:HBL/NHE enterotoxin family protein [Streptomyces sp. S186]|uniref:HBL/NHE enterotoxin family protein n=1 Tax=Streptomyces sp. S186 TaxID=3434395 RepID=UPI003F6697AC
MLFFLADSKQQAFGTNGKLQQHAQNTGAHRALVDTYATNVLEQPAVKLDKLTDAEKYQTAAKAHATSWRDSVSGLLIGANTDLMSFSNSFTSFYNPLMSMAQNIATGDNRAQFVKGLQILVSQIEDKRTKADGALDALKSFRNDVADDHGHFLELATKSKSLYEGDKGIISQLENRQDAIRQAMSTDLSIIAGGAALTVVGGLAIAVGLLAEIPSGGASTAIVLGGLAAVGGGTVAMGVAGADFTAKKSELAKNITDLANIRSEIGLLSGVELQFNNLAVANEKAEQSLKSMADTWTLLHTQFNGVITKLHDEVNPDDGPFLAYELDSAKKDWESVHDTAQLINNQLSTLPVDKSGLVTKAA